MRRTALTIALTAALLLCASPASADKDADKPIHGLLAGNDQGAWLVLPSDDGKTFDVAARPLGQPWAWTARQCTGSPARCVAVGGSLYVLLDSAILIFPSPDGQPVPGLLPRSSLWPVKTVPAALCEGDGLAEAKGTPSVIAVVPRPEPNDPAAPAEPNRTAKQPGRTGISLFHQAKGQWRVLGELERPVVGPTDRAFAACIDATVFVLVADANRTASELLSWRDGKWSQPPLPPAAARDAVVGMIALRGRLAVLLASTDPNGPRGALSLAVRENDANGFAMLPLRQAGGPLVGDSLDAVQAARLGDFALLLWDRKGRTYLTTCNVDGMVLSDQPLELPEQNSAVAIQIVNTFLWVVLLAAFALVAVFRPKTPPKPFTLPPTMKPASLPKRLAAAAVDTVPHFAIAWSIFLPPDLAGQYARLYQSDQMSLSIAYATVTALSLLVVYGTVMELRFGATVGKLLLGLRVVGEEGARPSARDICIRNLWKAIELTWPLFRPLLPVVIFLNRRHRRVGDWLARTAVVEPAPPGQATGESQDSQDSQDS